MLPAKKASAEGRPQSPACSGESSSTDCGYCAMKRNIAKISRKPAMLVAIAALKAGARKRPRSIKSVLAGQSLPATIASTLSG